MIQFFARVVELREGKIAFASESVKCDGKITMDFPSREFLEVTNKSCGFFGSYHGIRISRQGFTKNNLTRTFSG